MISCISLIWQLFFRVKMWEKILFLSKKYQKNHNLEMPNSNSRDLIARVIFGLILNDAYKTKATVSAGETVAFVFRVRSAAQSFLDFVKRLARTDAAAFDSGSSSASSISSSFCRALSSVGVLTKDFDQLISLTTTQRFYAVTTQSEDFASLSSFGDLDFDNALEGWHFNFTTDGGKRKGDILFADDVVADLLKEVMFANTQKNIQAAAWAAFFAGFAFAVKLELTAGLNSWRNFDGQSFVNVYCARCLCSIAGFINDLAFALTPGDRCAGLRKSPGRGKWSPCLYIPGKAPLLLPGSAPVPEQDVHEVDFCTVMASVATKNRLLQRLFPGRSAGRHHVLGRVAEYCSRRRQRNLKGYRQRYRQNHRSRPYPDS